ncbi:nuclear transport factor 2 family protein [Aestuariibius insulae]|uniref:nuclear transport factor 2 family protein n=1 Tax=Aestuariibius insulae TaxID=2058287 RepID=UPI00345E0EF2
MTRFASLALATFLAAPATAQIGGDPVTTETLVDRAEMIRIADAIDAAVDAKDWPAARAFFTETIEVDFTSLAGGEPATIPADTLIAGWSGNLTEMKESFHLRGNHRIAFDGSDTALMTSHGYAWNRMPTPDAPDGALWEVWGTYEHGFTRSGDAWLVDSMTFTATAQRGETFVRDTPGN